MPRTLPSTSRGFRKIRKSVRGSQGRLPAHSSYGSRRRSARLLPRSAAGSKTWSTSRRRSWTARLRPSVRLPRLMLAWPRSSIAAGLPLSRACQVRVAREKKFLSPARFWHGRGRVPGQRARPRPHSGNPETAAGSHPRRRLPSPDGRCRRVRDAGRHPPPGRASRSDPRKIAAATVGHLPADPGAYSQRPARAARSRADSHRLSQARCAGPSWRRSASSGWRRPSVGCASPCIRPKGR